MHRKTGYRLGDLQLRILKVLWREGTASVAEVHSALASPAAVPLAYTTVATMLRKMEAKGLVGHREEGRRFIYIASVTAEDVNRSTTEDVVERLFEGSLAETVSHLLQTREVSLEELDRLEHLIQERKRQQDTAGPFADRQP